ncbi:MAG: polyhydroxyalkanoate synthesis repressor PhaR [Woeseiaceae bacterium]|nr:polyhydroxyalkanoate synthesis repressor PhaR [Woeseiaceae bacterium]
MNRVIKKYPNRRLYDTEESRYITLADIRELVLRDISFEVIDKKSGDDITRSILMQVISEQEQHGEPLLNVPFLSQIIRAHESASPDFLSRHLEKALANYLAQQQQQQPVTQVVGADIEPPLSESTGHGA